MRQFSITKRIKPGKTELSQALKQSKYALLKPEDKLTESQKIKLEEDDKFRRYWQMHKQKNLEQFWDRSWLGRAGEIAGLVAETQGIFQKVSEQFAAGLVK